MKKPKFSRRLKLPETKARKASLQTVEVEDHSEADPSLTPITLTTIRVGKTQVEGIILSTWVDPMSSSQRTTSIIHLPTVADRWVVDLVFLGTSDPARTSSVPTATHGTMVTTTLESIEAEASSP